MVGTVGMGAIPPNYALARAAGAGSVPSDPVALLQAILGEMQAIRARLAPQPLMQLVHCDGIAPGEFTNVINIDAPSFNSFLVCVEQGAAIVYLGGARGTRFIRLPKAEIPYLVPFAPQDYAQITIQSDPDSTDTLIGDVYVQSY